MNDIEQRIEGIEKRLDALEQRQAPADKSDVSEALRISEKEFLEMLQSDLGLSVPDKYL